MAKSPVIVKQKEDVKTFVGGTFSEIVRAYSSDRMKSDPLYRKEVIKAIRARKKNKPKEEQ